MRRISTGAEQLLTADDVADAIVTYATALARSSTADSITIPIVRDDGAPDAARMLLGPASQLTMVPDCGAEVDLPDAAEMLRELQRRIVALEPAGSEDSPVDDGAPAFPDFDAYG
jgi:hypothetical protein